jgi:nucleotide-binding universal stress UspA family protein
MQKELADRTKNKITISTEMKYGSVEPEVERMCYEIKPFALVVAGKSGNTLQRFFMGSTTLRMVHHILYPVLIVPADVSFSVVKNITVASDLQGDRENTSVLFTKKILQAFHASLKIIHVNTNHHSENSVQAGIDFLQHSFADFKPGFHFITKENVQSGIADYLKTNQTDLLIVMPERHGLLASLIQPSESNRVILHAHLPIMSVAVTKLPLTIAANKGQFPSLENELGLPANKKLAENQPDQTHSPI